LPFDTEKILTKCIAETDVQLRPSKIVLAETSRTHDC